MRRAIIKSPSNNDEKVAASDFSIEIKHKGRGVNKISIVNYTYEDVFEYIKEQYEHDLDFIEKVTIEVNK